jgi:hypothetical protein
MASVCQVTKKYLLVRRQCHLNRRQRWIVLLARNAASALIDWFVATDALPTITPNISMVPRRVPITQLIPASAGSMATPIRHFFDRRLVMGIETERYVDGHGSKKIHFRL